MKVLVTGGAGYIGSPTVKELLTAGHVPVIVDDLTQGHREAVLGGEFHEASLEDTGLLRSVLRKKPVEAVIHFAAHCSVGESMSEPLRYYRNNVANALNLLEAAIDGGVRFFVFSSSAATYGEPEQIPIPESHPLRPVSVYGETKLIVEKLLWSLDRSHGLRSAAHAHGRNLQPEVEAVRQWDGSVAHHQE